jgi:hypothetical protein
VVGRVLRMTVVLLHPLSTAAAVIAAVMTLILRMNPPCERPRSSGPVPCAPQ